MLFSLLFSLLLLALPAAARPGGRSQPPMGLEPLLRRFAADDEALARFYELPFSAHARRRREAFLTEWDERLGGMDFARLSPDAQVDYLLLAGHLEHERARLVFRQAREAQMQSLLPFAPEIVALEERRQRLEPVDPEKAAETLARILQAVRESEAALQKALAEKAGPAAALALRSAGALRDLRERLGRWFAHYDGFQPLFSWWCRQPQADLAKELETYETRLREEAAGIRGKDDDPLVGDPIGRDALLADLRYERLAATPEELAAVAQREMAWCEEEMKKASRAMGRGEDWKAALEAVKAEHVPPGAQDELVVRQAREAIAFVEARDLVTIEPLCRETWRVDMLGREAQKTLPFAAYGGQKMLVAYPLESMDHATKRMSLRGNNIHFSRIVTPHELIPGHHLQGYMAERYRAYRRPFSTPFLVEGWALHWEMLLWDLGYPQTPQNRIGMLFWRMHRCARILVSLGFHLGTMTPAQMIDFLVERVGHERFTATSEVRRFIGEAYSPLYQCAYMIGGLQLRGLYQEQVVRRGGSPRSFHDAVLQENAIPIDLIAARLSARRLTRQAPPQTPP